MVRKIKVTNRDVMRNWPMLREKLKSGELDSIEISSNGSIFVIRSRKQKHRPGDISDLLRRIENNEVRYKIRRPKWDWTVKPW